MRSFAPLFGLKSHAPTLAILSCRVLSLVLRWIPAVLTRALYATTVHEIPLVVHVIIACLVMAVNPLSRQLYCLHAFAGAYIFRPNHTDATAVASGAVSVAVQQSSVVTVVTQTWASSWLKQEIRLWAGQEYVEVEFAVGPVPIDDQLGKEVVTRYTTGVESNGYIYTDSNGREMQQRLFNYRPTWNLTVEEPVAGNYYPLNAIAHIKDQFSQFSVLPDRSQGAVFPLWYGERWCQSFVTLTLLSRNSLLMSLCGVKILMDCELRSFRG
jgi:hypothetical protein